MQGELELVAHARRSDPLTSHEAAASLTTDKLRDSQRYVLAMFCMFGDMTDDDLVRKYDERWEDLSFDPQSPSGIRTRRKELADARKLVAVGTEVLASGRRAIVWGVAK